MLPNGSRCKGGSTLLATNDWDALCRRSKITFGNNSTATYGYQPNDDLAAIIHQLKTSAVTGWMRRASRSYTGLGAPPIAGAP